MKLFRKPNSRFYWYDFTVRGHRYRGSTQETKLARTAKAASVKLGSVIEGTDPFQLRLSYRFPWCRSLALHAHTRQPVDFRRLDLRRQRKGKAARRALAAYCGNIIRRSEGKVVRPEKQDLKRLQGDQRDLYPPVRWKNIISRAKRAPGKCPSRAPN